MSSCIPEDTAAALRREAEELKALLADVRSTSRDLLASGPRKKEAMTDTERREIAKSSWAKSGTKRRSPAGALSPTTGNKLVAFDSTRRTLHKADLGDDKVYMHDDVVRIQRALKEQEEMARSQVMIHRRLQWIREEATAQPKESTSTSAKSSPSRSRRKKVKTGDEADAKRGETAEARVEHKVAKHEEKPISSSMDVVAQEEEEEEEEEEEQQQRGLVPPATDTLSPSSSPRKEDVNAAAFPSGGDEPAPESEPEPTTAGAASATAPTAPTLLGKSTTTTAAAAAAVIRKRAKAAAAYVPLSKASAKSTFMTEKAPHGGYSFGKAKPPARGTIGGGGEGAVDAIYDTEKAQSFLLGKGSGAVPLMKPPLSRSLLADKLEQEQQNSNEKSNSSDEKDYGEPDKSLVVLSRHARVPAFTIMAKPASVKDEEQEALLRQRRLEATTAVGPGSYNIEAAKPGIGAAATASGPKGRIYRAPTSLQTDSDVTKAGVAMVLAEKRRDGQSTGPGYYDTSTGEQLLSRSRNPVAKGTVMMDKQLGGSQPKATKQLLRKRYWEEKAADLRETSDMYSRNSSSSMSKTDEGGSSAADARRRAENLLSTTSRAPSFAFAPTQQQLVERMSEKELRVFRKRKAAEEALRAGAQGAMDSATYSSIFGEHSGDFGGPVSSVASASASAAENKNVKRDAVEARVKGSVFMERSRQAEAATQRLLSEKPLVAEVLQARRQGDKARDAYYGPNIPVAWAGGTTIDNDDDDDGDDDDDDADADLDDEAEPPEDGGDSPTRQVTALLRAKERRRKQQARDEKRRRQHLLASQVPPDSDAAKAFLAAQARAAVRGAPVMARKAHELRPEAAMLAAQKAREDSGVDREWTGPQVPTEHLVKKGGVLDFDLLNKHGRSSVKVVSKDTVVVKEFGDARPLAEYEKDKYGPGAYDIESAKPGIGHDKARVKGAVYMDRLVARQDAMGPNGEAPESAQAELGLAAEDDNLMREMLDVDYGIAKDQYLDLKQEGGKNKKLVLYRKDRHEERDKQEKELETDPLNQHLGGSYYEDKGLAKALEKRPKNDGKFDKAPGRSDGKKGGVDGGDKMKNAEDLLMEEILADVDGIGHLHAMDERMEGGHVDTSDADKGNPMHKRNVFLAKFDDPTDRPRWEEPELEGHTAAEYDVNIEAVREKPGPFLVDFERQRGRGERKGDDEHADAEMDRIIAEEVGDGWGEVDREVASALAYEREEKASKAATYVNPKLSAASNPMHVNMASQRGRGEEEDKLLDRDGRIRATGLKPDHPGYEIKHPVRPLGEGAGLGHADFSDRPGRSDADIDAAILADIQAEAGLGGNIGHGSGGGLDLDGKDSAVKATSKWKADDPVPTLYRQERPEANPTVKVATSGLDLDYGDQDPTLLKKGARQFTKKGDKSFAGKPSMASQVGRRDTDLTNHEQEALREALGDEMYAHAVGASAGNQLTINALASEATLTKNTRGGSMPGVTGRPSKVAPAKKEIKMKTSKAEVEEPESKQRHEPPSKEQQELLRMKSALKKADQISSTIGSKSGGVKAPQQQHQQSEAGEEASSKKNISFRGGKKAASTSADKKGGTSNSNSNSKGVTTGKKKGAISKPGKSGSEAKDVVKSANPTPGVIDVRSSVDYSRGDGMGEQTHQDGGGGYTPLQVPDVSAPEAFGRAPAADKSATPVSSHADKNFVDTGELDAMMAKFNLGGKK